MATSLSPVVAVPFKAFGLGLTVLALLALTGCPKKGDTSDAGEVEDSGGGGGGGAGGGGGGPILTPDDGGQGTLDAGQRACDPVTNAGCTGDKPKCGIVGNKFACQAAGTVAEAAACVVTAAGDDCSSGLVCLNGTCAKACEKTSSTSCPTNEACALRVTFNGGPPYGEIFDVCVSTVSQCDILTQSCVPTTDACFPSDSGNKCHAPGTIADKATCQYYHDCKKGSACYDIGAGFKCYQVCSVATGTSDAGTADAGSSGSVHCTTGTCVGFAPQADGGRLDYGLCN